MLILKQTFWVRYTARWTRRV